MSLYACALGGIVFDPMLFTPIAVRQLFIYWLISESFYSWVKLNGT